MKTDYIEPMRSPQKQAERLSEIPSALHWFLEIVCATAVLACFIIITIMLAGFL